MCPSDLIAVAQKHWNYCLPVYTNGKQRSLSFVNCLRKIDCERHVAGASIEILHIFREIHFFLQKRFYSSSLAIDCFTKSTVTAFSAPLLSLGHRKQIVTRHIHYSSCHYVFVKRIMRKSIKKHPIRLNITVVFDKERNECTKSLIYFQPGT